MRRVFSAAVSALLVAWLCGCTQRLIDFTMISTKNIDLSKAAQFKRGKSRCEGVDDMHLIIFIPTNIPNMKEAVDRAIESVPGCVALVDGVLTHTYWTVILYSYGAFVVEGTPLIDPTLAEGRNLEGNYVVVRMNEEGEVADVRTVSRETYEALNPL